MQKWYFSHSEILRFFLHHRAQYKFICHYDRPQQKMAYPGAWLADHRAQKQLANWAN
jgi:hypothetical protein